MSQLPEFFNEMKVYNFVKYRILKYRCVILSYITPMKLYKHMSNIKTALLFTKVCR